VPPAAAGELDTIFGPPIGQRDQKAQPAPMAPAQQPPAALPAQPVDSAPTAEPRPIAAPAPSRHALAPAARETVAAPAGAVPMPMPRPGTAVATAVAAPSPAATSVPRAETKTATAAPMSLHPAPTAAAAAPVRPAPIARDGLTAEQVGAVERVDAWFNSVRHLVGNFTQIAPNGQQTHGRFYLSKPGKVRFDYAAPSTLDIICDGTSVAVYDRSVQTQQLYPLSETPLRYLLKPNLDLLRDAHVVGVSVTPKRITISVEERSSLVGTSRLNVVFSGAPLTLARWTITDPQGLKTTVAVSDLNTQTVPPDHLFAINYMNGVSTYR